MSTKGSRRGRDIFIGGSVTGSNVIGDNNRDITITLAGETGAASLGDLREAIVLLRAEIEAAGGGSTDTEQVQSELRQFEKELAKDEPDSDMVSIRWKLVQKLLGPLEHVASIAQLANRILALIGGN
jgi:hypothetical protein